MGVKRRCGPIRSLLKIFISFVQRCKRGTIEYSIPRLLRKIYWISKKCYEISSKYLQKQNGIMIGDAVGFGKRLGSRIAAFKKVNMVMEP